MPINNDHDIFCGLHDLPFAVAIDSEGRETVTAASGRCMCVLLNMARADERQNKQAAAASFINSLAVNETPETQDLLYMVSHQILSGNYGRPPR